MSMSLNRAQLIGNLTRDPEARQTSSGKSVVNFGIATNSRWTDASGQVQEKTEFHNIVVWGKLADICAQYIRKGSKVYVEGRIQSREWQGEDGVKRFRTEIVAENVIMLDRKGASSEGGSGFEQRSFGAGASSASKSVPMDAAPADDLPVTSGNGEIPISDLPF
ncbi:MAG: single-stranded DNA-binding protein [Candidatus Gracilibacteria bacterium]